jgi:hypothetical protein
MRTAALDAQKAFRHKKRLTQADFFALKGKDDEIITAFCFTATIAG